MSILSVGFKNKPWPGAVVCTFTPSTWETDSRAISVSTRPLGLCNKFQTQAGGGSERKERRNEGRWEGRREERKRERKKTLLLNMDCTVLTSS